MTQNEKTNGDLNRDAIGRVLGRTPSGVFILTATDGGDRATGMLASWVQQASFEPPTVTVAVNKKRYLHDWLKASPTVVLNLVGETQGQFLKHFGRGFEPDQDAFDGVESSTANNGIPALTECLGWLEGRVTSSLEAGDHIVYLVEIDNASATAALESEKPMVHIRKNGFGY